MSSEPQKRVRDRKARKNLPGKTNRMSKSNWQGRLGNSSVTTGILAVGMMNDAITKVSWAGPVKLRALQTQFKS